MRLTARAAVFTVSAMLASLAHADFFVTSRDAGNGDLYRFTQAGVYVATLKGNGLVNGQGVVVGPNGNVFVSNEAGNVLQYNA